jgi:hypothetical protein
MQQDHQYNKALYVSIHYFILFIISAWATSAKMPAQKINLSVNISKARISLKVSWFLLDRTKVKC